MTNDEPFKRPVTERLRDSQRLWDRHAAADPLWAVLSDPATLLYELGCLIEVRREAALDFGCGVGRLTQALAPHFARVVGVFRARGRPDAESAPPSPTTPHETGVPRPR